MVGAGAKGQAVVGCWALVLGLVWRLGARGRLGWALVAGLGRVCEGWARGGLGWVLVAGLGRECGLEAKWLVFLRFL